MNNDLISREALKEKISELIPRWNRETEYGMGRVNSYEFVIKIIDNAPTVEPFEPDYVGAERLKARQTGYNDGYYNGMAIGKTLNPKIKQGEWIIVKDEKHGDNVKCPFCGKEIAGTDLNFCVKCGADMRSEAQDVHSES